MVAAPADVHMPRTPPSFDIVTFPSVRGWARWLSVNHAQCDGVWLRFFKKASAVPSVTYAEALEEALCYGWIDGQAKKYDADSYLQKFTPRRKRSVWSKLNVARALKLIEAGRMRPTGLHQIEAARQDGRWEDAYDSPSRSTVPDDLQAALEKNKKARAFFDTLNKTNRYAITWRLQTARKPETRERRLKVIVAMLAKGDAFHP
jgi:uncharacterized protein YdeI (YjbR/CyaY-like superfamily)